MPIPNLNPKKEFSKIYDKHIEKIYRFIFLKVNSQEVAEDLTSETFLRCWQVFQKSHNPGKFNQKIENPSAFLYQIARNLVIDYYREKGKKQVISAEYRPIIDPRQNLEEKSLLNSDFERIRICLAGLKDDYQNVIILRYLEDKPIAEMAKLLDRSEEAVRVLLHRALKTLRTSVEKEQNFLA